MKVVGSNLGAAYWMDMTFFTLIFCKNCNDVCLKRPKISEKEVEVGYFKNYLSVTVNVSPHYHKRKLNCLNLFQTATFLNPNC